MTKKTQLFTAVHQDIIIIEKVSGKGLIAPNGRTRAIIFRMLLPYTQDTNLTLGCLLLPVNCGGPLSGRWCVRLGNVTAGEPLWTYRWLTPEDCWRSHR